jgi:hypothetical protein
MSSYRHDEDVREHVTRLLYEALPALYRAQDERGREPAIITGVPPATGLVPDSPLLRLLRVLAAPYALVRQNIEELHADLFIDTGHDHIIPLLADMVGTTLVFPDADANRRDVRGTVGWRRRKGSLRMLQEMGEELTAQLVVAQEGWRRLQLAQDLNLLRPERVVPDLRPALVAAQATGPLDVMFHALDARAISASSGRHHPRHVVHWLFPTLTFPLRRARAVSLARAGSDQRFAMHPLGEWRALRARSSAAHPLRSDRIPPLHFAARPEDWFGVPGRFSLEICGLPAGVAGLAAAPRSASPQLADLELVRDNVTITLLDHDPRAFQGRMFVDVGSAPFVALGADAWRADVSAFQQLASVELDSSGVVSTSISPAPSVDRAVMLRIRPPFGIGGRFFPGATIEIAGGRPAARAAANSSELAREGFLQGALHVCLPALRVLGERYLFVAADGSVYDAHDPASGAPDAELPRSAGQRLLARRQLLQAGPGAAWPPALASADPSFVTRLPAAPGRGPCVMHGGIPLRPVAGELVPVLPTTRSALVFAIHEEEAGSLRYRPFQRLTWSGSDAGSGIWSALGWDGLPVASDASSVSAQFAAVAALRDRSQASFPLAVRFECSISDASLTPAEVAWTDDEGTTVLMHLPQLAAQAAPPEPWPRESALFAGASAPVRVARDGSTWAATSTANLRLSLGSVAPIRESSALRRRRVRWRRLCAWRNEDWSVLPPKVLAFTRRGSLDVDVEHGLFALAAEEPPQAWPADAAGYRPPNVTASFEDGATMHIGARPDAREPLLDEQLSTPTRIVSASGHASADASSAWHRIPRYTTLSDALSAISNEWQNLSPAQIRDFASVDSFSRAEVIQIEDSATYHETPVWPGAPLNPAVAAKARFSLTLQAVERERPILLIDPALGFPLPAAPARYEQLTLVGIALGGAGWTGMRLPLFRALRMALCSLLHPENQLALELSDHAEATFLLCELAGLHAIGPGRMTLHDCIVDAGANSALRSDGGQIALDRSTVGGPVFAQELHASEVIFDDAVLVADRFHGCVRFSRVSSDSVLPRMHRCAVGVRVAYVSLDRHDPAWRRLRADADARIARGAENGSEMGAFSATRHAERLSAFELRQREYTPAGIVTGTIRLD